MKDKFPNPEPFVLTHGDLTFGNIIVKEDKITEIIDGEYAGYYPWGAERFIHENYAIDGSHDLLGPIWNRLSPRPEKQRYREVVANNIRPVLEAWDACTISHTRNRNSWYRPAFAQSEPWAGNFWLSTMGGDLRKVNHCTRQTSSWSGGGGGMWERVYYFALDAFFGFIRLSGILRITARVLFFPGILDHEGYCTVL
jgi:hypothetical protein